MQSNSNQPQINPGQPQAQGQVNQGAGSPAAPQFAPYNPYHHPSPYAHRYRRPYARDSYDDSEDEYNSYPYHHRSRRRRRGDAYVTKTLDELYHDQELEREEEARSIEQFIHDNITSATKDICNKSQDVVNLTSNPTFSAPISLAIRESDATKLKSTAEDHFLGRTNNPLKQMLGQLKSSLDKDLKDVPGYQNKQSSDGDDFKPPEISESIGTLADVWKTAQVIKETFSKRTGKDSEADRNGEKLIDELYDSIKSNCMEIGGMSNPFKIVEKLSKEIHTKLEEYHRNTSGTGRFFSGAATFIKSIFSKKARREQKVFKMALTMEEYIKRAIDTKDGGELEITLGKLDKLCQASEILLDNHSVSHNPTEHQAFLYKIAKSVKKMRSSSWKKLDNGYNHLSQAKIAIQAIQTAMSGNATDAPTILSDCLENHELNGLALEMVTSYLGPVKTIAKSITKPTIDTVEMKVSETITAYQEAEDKRKDSKEEVSKKVDELIRNFRSIMSDATEQLDQLKYGDISHRKHSVMISSINKQIQRARSAVETALDEITSPSAKSKNRLKLWSDVNGIMKHHLLDENGKLRPNFKTGPAERSLQNIKAQIESITGGTCEDIERFSKSVKEIRSKTAHPGPQTIRMVRLMKEEEQMIDNRKPAIFRKAIEEEMLHYHSCVNQCKQSVMNKKDTEKRRLQNRARIAEGIHRSGARAMIQGRRRRRDGMRYLSI